MFNKIFKKGDQNSQDKKSPFKKGGERGGFQFKKFRYIPKTLSKFEKRLILILFFVILGSIFWLGIRAYPKHIRIEPDYGGTYSEGVVGEPLYINPILAPSSDTDLDISKLVFSGLMKYNEKQEQIPDLAENYEVSEDQKNYIFRLRKNAKWHDSQNLTADDVVFTVQCIKNPEYQSPLRANFQNIAVEKIDDYTIKFTLTEETFAPFLKESTTFGILPQHIWSGIPPKNVFLSEYNLKPIGSGPFKFFEYKKDKKSGVIKSYTLALFKDYFGKKPYIKEISFKFYDDYPALISAYNHKEVDGISFVPAEEKSNIKKKVNYFLLKLPRYYNIFLNQSKNKILEKKEVRKALVFGVDRQRIVNEALSGEGMIVDSPVLPGFLGFNPEVQKYNYDPSKANDILHQAGWRDDDRDGIRSQSDTKLEITLTYAAQPEFAQASAVIRENWEKIGVKTNLQEIDPTILQSEYIRPRNYEALIYGQLISRDPDPYPFWHSSQREDPGLNLTSFKDKTADTLLEEARQTSDEKERRLKYLHFQNILAEEVPAVFLYSSTYLYGAKKNVRGIELEYITTPSDRFSNIENWYIKINRRWK
jgi:peptide/nickel transport system substrate-binding protein